jgi:hypothetical protein
MSAVSLTAEVQKFGVNLYVTITAFCDGTKLPILRNSETARIYSAKLFYLAR